MILEWRLLVLVFGCGLISCAALLALSRHVLVPEAGGNPPPSTGSLHATTPRR
jgi:hypothetical protein